MSILESVSRVGVGVTEQFPGSLEVVVLHTTTKETLEALQAAARMAGGLGAHIRLLVLETVPCTGAGNPASVECAKRRFRTVAADARVETHVDIRLGSDFRNMLESALKPRSLIVVGGKRGWWPSFRHRLAHRLEQRSHHVVFSGAK